MPVLIERIETIPVLYPTAGHFKFFESSGGRPPGRPAVLVQITDSAGCSGWGESVPSPRWSYETLETVESTIRTYLAPTLLGCDTDDDVGLRRKMNQAIAPSFSTGQPIAKSGVELALFDLVGRRRRQSAFQRRGRSDRPEIELSWTLNPRSLAELAGEVAIGLQRGYTGFNLKVAPDLAADLRHLGEIRRLAPQASLWVDANGGFTPEEALAAAPRFADLGVAFFEQPCPANRLSAYARLRRQGALPIVMDEGLVSCVDLEEFHRLGLLDGAAIKVARVGGLEEARKQVEFLEQNGLLFVGSGLTDPDVALSASLSLFCAFGLQHPAALNGPQYLTGSVLRSPLRASAGRIPAPCGFGLGIEVDPQAVDALRLW